MRLQKTWVTRSAVNGIRFLLCVLQLAAGRTGEVDPRYNALVAPAPVVPEGENGWFLMMELPPPAFTKGSQGKQFVVMPEEATADKPAGVDRVLLEKQMKANADLLKQCAEVMKRSGFYRPLRTYNKADEENLSGLGRFYVRAKMGLASSLLRAQDGQVAGGFSDILAEMKFDQRMMNSGSSELITLAASNSLRLAAKHAGWAGQLAPDAATAKKFADALLEFEDIETPLISTLQAEFRSEQSIQEICRKGGSPLTRMVVEHHFTVNKLADILPAVKGHPKQDISGSEEDWIADPPASVIADIKAIKSLNLDALLERYAKEYCRVVMAPATSWTAFRKACPEYEANVFDLHETKPTFAETLQSALKETSSDVPVLYKSLFTCQAQIRLARLALLVKAWRLDHSGELPDSLDQLIPAYMSALPIDPFDGEPLRYDKATRRLWSVSKSMEEGKFHFDDIVQVIVD